MPGTECRVKSQSIRMYKHITFIFICFAITLTGVAQETELDLPAANDRSLATTYLGIRSGMIMSTVTGRAEPQAIGLGGSLGLVVQHRFSKRFGIQAEALFDTKGYVSRTKINGTRTKEKSRLQYIDIPLTVRTYFGKHEVNKGFFGIGPYLGIGLYEKYMLVEYELFDKQKTLIRYSFKNKFNRLDAGFDVELGYIIDLKENRALELNFQQSIGITKLSEVSILGKIRNLYQSFTIAYLFGMN